MSPNINSFVGDLVEMARAMEELPDVKAKLTSANSFIDDLANTVQERELRIIELKAEIDRQAHTITTLEVARDDAELRFLEADDRMGKIASAFQMALEAMDHTDKVIEQAREALHPTPPMPEPEVQAQPVDLKPESIEGAGESHPTFVPYASSTESVLEASSVSSVAMSGDPSNVDSWASGPAPDWAQDKAETSLIKPTGQSEPLPTMIENPKVDGDTMTNIIQTGESFKPSGRYSGKRYYDWPTYIPLSQWLDGGGTQADYDWRPGKIASC